MSINSWLDQAVAKLLPEPDPELVEHIDVPTARLVRSNRKAWEYNSLKFHWISPRNMKEYMPDVHIKLKFGNDAVPITRTAHGRDVEWDQSVHDRRLVRSTAAAPGRDDSGLRM